MKTKEAIIDERLITCFYEHYITLKSYDSRSMLIELAKKLLSKEERLILFLKIENYWDDRL
jgi:hypothetical protein